MTDVHSPSVRSKNMAAIKSKNTKPEIFIRSMLHRMGYRFRIHSKSLPGKPDIVLPKHKAVILVNGCFWHRHTCNFFRLPKTRTEFWKEKIDTNVKRDNNNIGRLLKDGWRVLIIWECSLKGRQRIEENELITKIDSWIKSRTQIAEIPCP